MNNKTLKSEFKEEEKEFIIEQLNGVEASFMSGILNDTIIQIEEDFELKFGSEIGIDEMNFHELLNRLDMEQCERCDKIASKDNGFGHSQSGEVCCDDCLDELEEEEE